MEKGLECCLGLFLAAAGNSGLFKYRVLSRAWRRGGCRDGEERTLRVLKEVIWLHTLKII